MNTTFTARKIIAQALIILLVTGAFYGGYCDEQPNKKRFPVIVSAALMFSGAAYAVYHFRVAQIKYDEYHKSAFTDNTNDLRREIAEHDKHTFVGGAIAGISFLTLTIAF